VIFQHVAVVEEHTHFGRSSILIAKNSQDYLELM